MSSTGRRDAGSLLCRHQFCTQNYTSRAMYCHGSNTDNTEVAVGSRCFNTYRHERLQQHVSLGKLIIFSSLLSPCSSTLLRQRSFRTCFSAAPMYVREQNLVSFLKSLGFLTCHKVAAGQKSCFSQHSVKLALLNRLFPETSLETCNRANN